MFGEGAGRLMALAARAFGWRPRDFWAATPAELAAILRGVDDQPAGMDAALLAQLRERCRDG